jgi:hypothetical protein
MLEIRGNAELGLLPRALLQRFGAEGRVAHTLLRQIYRSTTRRVVRDELDVYEQLRAHARVWSRDPAPEVRRWAQAVVAVCTQTIDERRARDEFERLYMGA